MKAIRLALFIGVLAEFVLCLFCALFGKVSLPGGAEGNAVGNGIFLYHLPGIALSTYIFASNPSWTGLNILAMTGIVIAGAIQSVLFAWIGILLCRKLRHRNRAQTGPVNGSDSKVPH
jgi:hypothetical protein